MRVLSSKELEAVQRSVLRRRWLNALRRTGITTVGELRTVSEKGLLRVPMIGPKPVADIAEALRDLSVCASDSIEVLGLGPARFISKRDRELVRMRQQGATIAMIARHFRISQVRVSQILDRDGW